MKTLVVGASGATGKKLVDQLLLSGVAVKVIVRSGSGVSEAWNSNDQLTIIEASILNISELQMSEYLSDCDAVASCLGHNMTLKGLFGKPKRLVKDSVVLLCKAIELNKPEKALRFVLMNTAGNSNRDLKEPISRTEKILLGIIRFLLPPHKDNEEAADYLRTQIGQNHAYVHWAVVRPDSLINKDEVSHYEVHPSPIRSAIFNAGKTSRINVGHFITKLITQNDIWNEWKGQMPVIYNK